VPDPTPRHWALAAEAVTGGPQHERDIVARVAQLAADLEHTAVQGAVRVMLTDADPDEIRLRLATEAQTSPRLAAIAAELRARGWRPPAGFSCGCTPLGLCPSHTALRDVEAAAVTA
jgi:hypothetical protein